MRGVPSFELCVSVPRDAADEVLFVIFACGEARRGISAAVEKCKGKRKPAAFFGHRKVELTPVLSGPGEAVAAYPVIANQ